MSFLDHDINAIRNGIILGRPSSMAWQLLTTAVEESIAEAYNLYLVDWVLVGSEEPGYPALPDSNGGGQ